MSAQIAVIIDIISKSSRPLSREEILAEYLKSASISTRTLIRRLNTLVSAGQILAEGKARARVYRLATASLQATVSPTAIPLSLPGGVPISEDGRDVLTYVSQSLSARRPVAYDRAFLESYEPNRTWYLGPSARQHLRQLGDTGTHDRPAGTFGRAVLNRLLIDLSWASSQLEGNTYTRLDTRQLIEHGSAATGKAAIETQMILNHKAAIELLLEEIDTVGFDLETMFGLHGLLAENLLPDPDAGGRLRTRPVDISGSVFRPLAVPQLIGEMARLLLAKASVISDPFEQALFVMIHVPYLQPFDDVNKRVSRLLANVSLIKANLCPLTFLDVPESAYVTATLGVYEMNRIELLRDLFIWAYERSAQEYVAVRKTLAEPDPFRLRYRSELHDVVAKIVRTLAVPAVTAVEKFAEEQIPEADRERFREVVLDELKRLHPGVLARYRLRASEFEEWQKIAGKLVR